MVLVQFVDIAEKAIRSFDFPNYSLEKWNRSKYTGDVENNHKMFLLNESKKGRKSKTSIITFKPCMDDESKPGNKDWEENGRHEIEKKLDIYFRVHFYERFESNAIEIGYSEIYGKSVYLMVFTIDDSMFRIGWNFNDSSTKEEIESLINSLYEIVKDIKVFSQLEFLFLLEEHGIRNPDYGWTN